METDSRNTQKENGAHEYPSLAQLSEILGKLMKIEVGWFALHDSVTQAYWMTGLALFHSMEALCVSYPCFCGVGCFSQRQTSLLFIPFIIVFASEFCGWLCCFM